MKVTFMYLVYCCLFSLVPAWLVGALISLIDLDAGIIIGSAVFSYFLIEMILFRKKKSIP